MSLWIECPELIDSRSGQSVWRTSDSDWSLDSAEWLDNSTVKVSLRKYPGNYQPSSLQAIIDCEKMTASLMGAPAIPLKELEAAMDASLTRVPG
jgi:hypothetical protein